MHLRPSRPSVVTITTVYNFRLIPPSFMRDMSVGRKVDPITGRPLKKERKAIDLELKLKVINLYDGGKKVNAIARAFQLAHSTVSTIIKDRDRILEAVKESVPLQSTIISQQRRGPIYEMEKLLILWIEGQIRNQTPLNFRVIQKNARSIYHNLLLQAGETNTSNFQASTGWFKNFKKRYCKILHNVRISEEVENTNAEAAEKFIDALDEVIQQKGYLPAQIFNVAETSFFWKRMPERTSIHKEAEATPGFKEFKDRLTLLLGGNVVGFKLKPYLIYRSDNPRSFKTINKYTLPVFYRANARSYMTQALFQDWFVNCFVPQVREYCLGEMIPCKILLILDRSPEHPPHLDDLHPDVKVMFLPPNTSPLVQPMDQGAIATFRAFYLRSMLAQAKAATGTGQAETFRDFWRNYDILRCVKTIALAWDLVPTQCMSGIWKKDLKRYANIIEGFDTEKTLDEIKQNIVKLAEDLELGCSVEDIEELLNSQVNCLTNKELMELETETVAEEERMREELEEPVKEFTADGLADGFRLMHRALACFEKMDQNVERFAKVERQIQEAVSGYWDIYEEKKKNIPHVARTKPSALPTSTPSPGSMGLTASSPLRISSPHSVYIKNEPETTDIVNEPQPSTSRK